MKKKAPLRLTYRARDDLIEIASYLARQASERVARRVVRDILARIEELRRFPASGSPRDHVRPGLRAVVRNDYVAYYVLDRGQVLVVAVVHGSRDVDTVFADRAPDG